MIDIHFSIKTDGTWLIVTRATDAARQKKFHAALKEIRRRYGKMLKRLAKLMAYPRFLSVTVPFLYVVRPRPLLSPDRNHAGKR